MFPGNHRVLDITTQAPLDVETSESVMRTVNAAGDRVANTEVEGTRLRVFSPSQREVSPDILTQIAAVLGDNFVASRYVSDEEAFPGSLRLS